MTDRYRCVAAQKADGFPVTAACEAAGVSPSAFYDWTAQAANPSLRELEEAYLLNEIIDLHELDDTYGRPRMIGVLSVRCAVLRRKDRYPEFGITVPMPSTGLSRVGIGGDVFVQVSAVRTAGLLGIISRPIRSMLWAQTQHHRRQQRPWQDAGPRAPGREVVRCDGLWSEPCHDCTVDLATPATAPKRSWSRRAIGSASPRMADCLPMVWFRQPN